MSLDAAGLRDAAGLLSAAWERLWLRKEQGNVPISVGAEVFATIPAGQQQTGLSVKKQSNPGGRLNFWESDWGRVGLGPGEV